VQLKMDDIQSMINGLSQEVISLTDTREQLMFVLINLFKRLGAGDRFLSLTSPHLWRGSALGLDGRYFTATAMAVKRGASVQRAFVFSVQEVGDDWAMDLARNLGELNQNNAQPAAGRLASSLLAAIKDYRAALQNENARKLPEDLRSDARRRLSLVIKSYFDASKGVCKSLFDQVDHFQTSAGCRGIYVGLIPVGTLREMRTRKAAHPFSVFFFNAVAKDDDRYLLVMTDCLGRNAVVDGDDKNYAGKVFQRSEPELKGITVFKSVFGFPEDTIKKLEQTFKTGAVGIGHWIDRLHAVLPSWEPRPKPASRLARAGRSL
jgi:hypothetical protein